MNKMLLAISNKSKTAVKTLLRRKHTFYFAVEFGDSQRGYLSGPRWFTLGGRHVLPKSVQMLQGSPEFCQRCLFGCADYFAGSRTIGQKKLCSIAIATFQTFSICLL